MRHHGSQRVHVNVRGRLYGSATVLRNQTRNPTLKI